MMFTPVARILPDQPMWAAAAGPYTFIITEDDGKFSASARRKYIHGEAITPGYLVLICEMVGSMQKAVEACNKWHKEHAAQ